MPTNAHGVTPVTRICSARVLTARRARLRGLSAGAAAGRRPNSASRRSAIALAHVNGDRVEAAYRRSDLFERRRILMQQWADYVAPRP